MTGRRRAAGAPRDRRQVRKPSGSEAGPGRRPGSEAGPTPEVPEAAGAAQRTRLTRQIGLFGWALGVAGAVGTAVFTALAFLHSAPASPPAPAVAPDVQAIAS